MNIWQEFKRSLSLRLWWFRHRRDKAVPEVVWPPQSARFRTVIVLLPENFEHFDLARRALSDARRKMDPLLFIVCLRDNYRAWIDATPHIRQVVYTDSEKNWLGLPRPNFIRRLRDYNPDMVIDLSPSYNPFLSHLCVLCGARLRLSLDYPNAGLFHNLLISPESEKPLSERYEILVSYLQGAQGKSTK